MIILTLQVRVWGLALLDSEIEEHMQLPGLDWQKHKRLLDAHYTMDTETDGKTTPISRVVQSLFPSFYVWIRLYH